MPCFAPESFLLAQQHFPKGQKHKSRTCRSTINPIGLAEPVRQGGHAPAVHLLARPTGSREPLELVPLPILLNANRVSRKSLGDRRISPGPHPTALLAVKCA